MQIPRHVQVWYRARLLALWAGRSTIQLARLAFAVLLILLADRVIAGEVTTDEAIAVAGLTLAALAVFALTPEVARGIIQRVSKISIGPVALEVFAEAGQVQDAKGTEETDGSEEQVESVLALRLKIERKLTYVAKHVLDEHGRPTFLSVGSLRYDKLLPRKEADLVNQLMTLRDEDIAELTPVERDKFLRAADKIARNIRASVLHCLVQKTLDEANGEGQALSGWKIDTVKRRGARSDFVAKRSEKEFRIASVFATDEGSTLLAAAKKRLAPGAKGEDRYKGRIIVLPHNSRATVQRDADPAVVTTDELVEVLAEAGR